MAAFTTEVFGMVSQRVAPQDLPAFPLVSTAFEQLSRIQFTDRCFEHMRASADMTALDLLLSAVSHGEFGPANKKITISMNGIDDKPAWEGGRFYKVSCEESELERDRSR